MMRRRKLIWIVVAVLAGLPIVVPMFTLNRAKQRILRSLDVALGRRVSASSVHLILFPWPGFELEQVRLAEDPAFGQEDMASAWDAQATLRLWSLWSGKLEFSSVRLDYPNINLVRNREGQWNLAAFLDRARQSVPPMRSTGARLSLDQSVRFPYFELSHGRINFKLNNEKTRLYLGNVEGNLALAGDRWRVHLRFQPMRNDLNLSDTGEVVVDGHWQAGRIPFRKLPFDVSVHVDNSYLAASSALFVGHDAGVHGILNVSMRAQGTGDHFQMSGTVEADSLRRWDMLPPPTTVRAAFLATYQPGPDTLTIEGFGDPGLRHLRLSGEIRQLFTHPQTDLALEVHQLPASALLTLARAVKGNLPDDLRATGTLNGQAELLQAPGKGFTGKGEFHATDLLLQSGADRLQAAVQAEWDGKRLVINGPRLTLAQGKQQTQLALRADLNANNFSLDLSSPDLVGPTAGALAHLWAVPSPWFATLTGTARVHLVLSALWSELRHPTLEGDETYARAVFHPAPRASIPLRDVVVHFADPAPTRIQFVGRVARDPVSGWVQLPVSMENLPAIPTPAVFPHFRVSAAHLSAAALWTLLKPRQEPGLLGKVLQEMQPSFLSRINAVGDIDIGDLDFRGYHAAVHAQVEAHGSKWSVPLLQLRMAGGNFDGSAELAQGVYSISGSAKGIHLGQLLTHSEFAGHVDGVLSGTLQLVRGAGTPLDAARANGTLALRSGWIAGLRNHRPLHAPFSRLAADYTLMRGNVRLEDVLLQMPSYPALRGTGTIHFDRGYDLTLKAGRTSWHLTGSFAGATPRRPPARVNNARVK